MTLSRTVNPIRRLADCGPANLPRVLERTDDRQQKQPVDFPTEIYLSRPCGLDRCTGGHLLVNPWEGLRKQAVSKGRLWTNPQ